MIRSARLLLGRMGTNCELAATSVPGVGTRTRVNLQCGVRRRGDHELELRAVLGRLRRLQRRRSRRRRRFRVAQRNLCRRSARLLDQQPRLVVWLQECCLLTNGSMYHVTRLVWCSLSLTQWGLRAKELRPAGAASLNLGRVLWRVLGEVQLRVRGPLGHFEADLMAQRRFQVERVREQREVGVSARAIAGRVHQRSQDVADSDVALGLRSAHSAGQLRDGVHQERGEELRVAVKGEKLPGRLVRVDVALDVREERGHDWHLGVQVG
mmetsp:Transcript_32214/g.55085  ORF Transcript_32214/g.55085 Transcript_32214/m.55085 type:complete len:267 (-) Transcript_32214:457-1257(-)